MSKYVTDHAPRLYRDVQESLRWTHRSFGPQASQRYASLIARALRDIEEDPDRPGARARPDLSNTAWVYHLAFSRTRVAGTRVKHPRHFVLYLREQNHLTMARLLHDSSDLARHLPSQQQED